jgi:LCP family protein required for cell wall assembly
MVRAGTGTPLWGAAGKAGYALSCLAAAVVLVLSGFSFFVVREVVSIGSSYAIQSGPSIGAQNILLMGLESRTYWNGQILPAEILADMHAGSVQGVENGVGGNTTNTLILIHIPAGGKKAVGFSIPRDDWVNFAGTLGSQQVGKIDQAYGASMAAKESQLRQQTPNMNPNQVAFEGNEAGRAATVATVEQLTGVHIDHFAEINLFGFYELAKVLGGVNVCLKAPTHDSNAGANFRAGYQHLDASQALAFVRQRDNLPNGDLDRTHRQQAFLDSVMQQLSKAGVLADLTKISALLSVAKQYVITDSGWNLLDFAAQMRDLTGGNIVFHTLPIVGYQTIDGQDANVVDPGHIKSIVQQTFYPTTTAAASSAPAAANSSARSGTSSPSPSTSPSSIIPSTGPQGGAVSAKNGIPCVY